MSNFEELEKNDHLGNENTNGGHAKRKRPTYDQVEALSVLKEALWFTAAEYDSSDTIFFRIIERQLDLCFEKRMNFLPMDSNLYILEAIRDLQYNLNQISAEIMKNAIFVFRNLDPLHNLEDQVNSFRLRNQWLYLVHEEAKLYNATIPEILQEVLDKRLGPYAFPKRIGDDVNE